MKLYRVSVANHYGIIVRRYAHAKSHGHAVHKLQRAMPNLAHYKYAVTVEQRYGRLSHFELNHGIFL